jgi:hypothetical protein
MEVGRGPNWSCNTKEKKISCYLDLCSECYTEQTGVAVMLWAFILDVSVPNFDQVTAVLTDILRGFLHRTGESPEDVVKFLTTSF